MQCEQAVLLVSSFLEDKLSAKDTKEFIEHLETCRDCFDETEVSIMVRYASLVLDQDDSVSYNLKQLLPNKITERKRWLRKRKMRRIIWTSVLVIFVLSVALGFLFAGSEIISFFEYLGGLF